MLFQVIIKQDPVSEPQHTTPTKVWCFRVTQTAQPPTLPTVFLSCFLVTLVINTRVTMIASVTLVIKIQLP